MNELETNLIQHLPDWFTNVGEFGAIMDAETAQMNILSQMMGAVYHNFFVQTMDEPTVFAWEQLVGIIASPSTETLTFRRARLQNRISTRPPFTLQFLYNKLDELLGAGNYSVEIDYPNYGIIIETAASNQAWSGELIITLNTIKPCHMVYTARPTVFSTIALSESVSLVKFTYNYTLGSWALGLLPFADEENQGVIITADQPSIQQELLNNTASFVAGDVASARINGSIAISSLQSSTADNVTTILYTVTQEQASTVTQIELLDADGNVLTSSGVYVPIVGNATFKHVFTTEEGLNNASS